MPLGGNGRDSTAFASPYTQSKRPPGHLAFKKYEEMSGGKATKSDLPTSHRRNNAILYTSHRKSLEKAKTTIDNKTPRPHPRMPNRKRQQLDEERMAEMDRDNLLLIEKIAKIMREGGDTKSLFKESPGKSLNNEKRRKELVKVMYENIAMLRRLMRRSTNYPRKDLERSWQIQQELVQQVARLPDYEESDATKRYADRVDSANRSIKSMLSAKSSREKISGGSASGSQKKMVHKMEKEETIDEITPVDIS